MKDEGKMVEWREHRERILQRLTCGEGLDCADSQLMYDVILELEQRLEEDQHNA